MDVAHKAQPQVIVMLGVHPASKQRGGIASVIDIYRREGLFDRWPIMYVGTFVSGSRLAKFRVGAAALWQYLRVLCAGRLALLHAHTASRASFWRKSIFILLALAARKPVILHLHGGEFADFYRNECGRIRQGLIRFVLNRVGRVVVLSSQWKQLIEAIAPAAQVVRIFNPVCVPAVMIAPAQRPANVLLFLGRFRRRKGIFDLLRALAVVRTRFPTVRLYCGGDGDAQAVAACARELGVEECVDVLGWTTGAAKERVLSQATLYVLPSYAEGLPMGVLEAMAAGIPVVATPIGGIPDAVEDGVEGFLVPPGDIDALADRIMRLLDSVGLRSAIAAAAGIKVREQFSSDVVLSQVEDLYRHLGAVPRELREHEHGLDQAVIHAPGLSGPGSR